MDPELVALMEELRAIAKALKEREAGLGDEVKAAVDEQTKDLRAQALAAKERLDELTAASDDEAATAAIEAATAPIRAQLADAEKRAEDATKRADDAAVVAKRPVLTLADPAHRVATIRTPEEDLERRGGFANLGEFIGAIRFNPSDTRLPALHERAMAMGVGAAGGFFVPPEFAEMLTAITPQDAIVRPRATVIPAGESPDASISIPADDQSGAKGVYSGVTVVWTGEGGTKSETEPALRQIELNPHEVSAYTILSDKLLRNTAAAGPYVESKLRAAILASEDQAFISGTGVAQPLGFLGHASAINVVRAGAGLIGFADVVHMLSHLLKRGGSPVWIGNPTTLNQLMIMPSVLGQLIWMPSAREGVPSTLLGIPFIENERQPVLGTAGDLMLVNLEYYVIKDGAALTIDVSQHIRFLNNQSVIRAVWNVDGQPTMNTPLLLEDGATQQSPFVVLQ